MDRMKFTTIAHGDHAVLSPISDEKLNRVVDLLDLPPGARVLDVGCGKGELLLRVVERWDAHGIGVDPNRAFLDVARSHADTRVGPKAIQWLETEMSAATIPPASLDAGMCVGATH